MDLLFTHPDGCVDFIGCFVIGRVREGNIDKILLRHNDKNNNMHMHEPDDGRLGVRC